MTAGLFLVLAFNFNSLADRLTIRNPYIFQLNINLELVLKFADDNIKVLVTDTAEYLLMCLMIVSVSLKSMPSLNYVINRQFTQV